jgi:hypothetical protein
MGGPGSGRRFWFNSKCTVGRKLDIHDLKKSGLLIPGTNFTTSWKRNGFKVAAISGTVMNDGIVLSYSCNGELIRYKIPFTWTSCNYGGKRPWWECPKCSRRIATLYERGKYFLCRKCHGLVYESQRERDAFRYLHKAQDIREKLGGSANVFEPLPDKPKRMRWQTYRKMRSEADKAYNQSLQAMSLL